ncbi:MAG: CCA tRNA nucleotidyltransferase, partial [Acidobacteriota bacterium]|nr:CCA tRNA nucleotidyltransferase [Acidobacteriota bacterium]
HGNLSNYELARAILRETPAEALKPRLLLRGDDLIAQGFVPGPRFKEMLRAVEDAQLDGKIHTREDALEMVQKLFT